MRYRNLCWVCLVWATALTQAQAAECEQLATLKLANTEITLAQSVPAGEFTPPPGSGAAGPPTPPGAYARLPAFCRVAGIIRPTADSDIRFEVWMPTANWNGKFVGVGNGVWAGSITHFAMVDPVSKGYASAATDAGHQGNPLDASFAAGHPEKLVDFGHRAVHEMTVAAKATIAAFYGKRASRSLFVSCSTGGRMGLMEAHRYPRDYDAISSMAPANPMIPLLIGSLWTGHAALKDAASRIPPPKFSVIHKAVLEACDADDGVKDGILSAPQRCKFDPGTLLCKGDESPECLTEAQLAALRDIYQGPRNARTGEQIYPGLPFGSEMMFPLVTMGPEPFPVATTYMKSLVFGDPKWDFRTFDYNEGVKRAMQVGSAHIDVPPDKLDSFFNRGGKLLLSHGWADGLISATGTVNFYEDLVKDIGPRKAARGTRLFLIPGMAHCGGGSGPFVFDPIPVLERWVDTGQAPERIVVSNPPAAGARTRPLCPWPQQAVYSGTGSTDEEQNFSCAAPAQ